MVKDYDFIKGKGIPHTISIKQQYSEYEPLPRKSKMPEIKAFYEEETDNLEIQVQILQEK